ncbi:MAG: hypothetical protein BWK75_04870 [Candidatus Altiarchaeales archaeon A3]|nr:MAG: hypothetical protein BWK75_04870 [Candidatus Altiarchaeales archaeon A3]
MNEKKEKNTRDESIMEGVKKLANLLGKSEEEILSLIDKKKDEMGGLINDYGALSGVASDFGVRISELTDENNISFSKIKDVLIKREISVNVVGRVKRVFPINDFQRKDGTAGKVARIIISDETGEIPVVLWDAHSEILNRTKFNDLVRIIKGNTKVSTFNNLERVEINLTTFSIIDINPEINDVKIKISEISERIQTLKEVKEKTKEDKVPVCVVGRIISDIESNEFERLDGSKGIRSPFFIEDETGTIRITVWDDMKDNKDKGINFGCLVKIRGMAKRGMLGDVEISTSSAGNIEKSNAKLNLPELKRISAKSLKIGEISDKYETLSEDEKRTFTLTTKGIITKNFGVKEFEGIQGNVGKRGAFMLNDDTGSMRIVIWNDAADFVENVSEGDAVEIKKGNIRRSIENCEIHIRKKNDINLIDKKEFAGLYISFSKSEGVEKKISEISDGDRNVKLVVKIADIDSNQQLTYPSCPTCNKKVMNVGNNEWYCEKCGTDVEQVPKLMLRIIASNIKGEEQIGIMFFGSNAEKIMGMNISEILNLVGESGEQAVIEKVKTEIRGSAKTITGHAKFNKNFGNMVFYADEIE